MDVSSDYEDYWQTTEEPLYECPCGIGNAMVAVVQVRRTNGFW